MKTYETVGDVRASADSAFATHQLRTAGGSFYPYIQGLVFGLVDATGVRRGDALCALPNGGWLSKAYSPEFNGQPTDDTDMLQLRTIQGAGKLTVAYSGVYTISPPDIHRVKPRNHSVNYGVINPDEELLIVHAQSTRYPENHTDINASGIRAIDNTQSLASDLAYRYEDVFDRPDGTVTIRLQQ